MLAHELRPARDFPAVLLPHPILGPLARRLLWGEYDDAKLLVRALRSAEDGSFADVRNRTPPVAGDGTLGIVHPAELRGDLDAWTRIFADYKTLQPFPQLHWPVVTLTEAERSATSLGGWDHRAGQGPVGRQQFSRAEQRAHPAGT